MCEALQSRRRRRLRQKFLLIKIVQSENCGRLFFLFMGLMSDFLVCCMIDGSIIHRSISNCDLSILSTGSEALVCCATAMKVLALKIDRSWLLACELNALYLKRNKKDPLVIFISSVCVCAVFSRARDAVFVV